ncbi:MAG: T9SS type A sorting domain-containing protein, partial [Bacteroidota bacterium]
PDMSGANTSATVAKFTALQTGQPFAGCESQHGADIGTFTVTPATNVIRIMVWKPEISDVGLKLVDVTSFSLGEIKVANTLVNQWEELTFDFSSHDGIEFDQIVIFPDFNARAATNVCYFDNITFGTMNSGAEPLVAAPTPTTDPALVISMFSDAYTDVAVDTWLTPWSVGTLTDVLIDGNATKRYNNLDFAGIETTGPNLIDATEMDTFHVDVWSEDMTEFRVKLVDFGADGSFQGGDDSEHEVVFASPAQNEWISYAIPLSDFTGLASREHMAQLIFAAEPANNSNVFIDNVYYSQIAPTTGVEEAADAINMSVYPNPVNDVIQVSSAQTIDQVWVYNLMGAELIGQTSQRNTVTLDASQLAPGTYVVKARVGANIWTQQVVKY